MLKDYIPTELIPFENQCREEIDKMRRRAVTMLKTEREELKLSQADLGKLAGISGTAIHYTEQNKKPPHVSLENIQKLGVSLFVVRGYMPLMVDYLSELDLDQRVIQWSQDDFKQWLNEQEIKLEPGQISPHGEICVKLAYKKIKAEQHNNKEKEK